MYVVWLLGWVGGCGLRVGSSQVGNFGCLLGLLDGWFVRSLVFAFVGCAAHGVGVVLVICVAGWGA